MIARLKSLLRGVGTAAAAMAVFAIALGCFMALMLLVISMEEGGDNLSSHALSLTAAVVLLSQGSGFTVGPVRLTLIPLLLTMLLIALVRAFAQRMSCDAPGYVGGLIAWLMLDGLFRGGTSVELHDDLLVTLGKGALVFSIGYLSAAVPVSLTVAKIAQWIRASIAQRLRATIRTGVMTAVLLILCYLSAGLITVIVWAARNHAAMAKLFDLLAMGTGSRILTTVACMAWLPNLCIWAVSWLFGAGFSIGDLGSFTLWIGQSTALPSIPVFGLLPEAVGDQMIRAVLVSIPLACGLLVGMIAMWSKRGFAMRVGGANSQPDAELVMSFAYPAGGFCISCALLSVASSLLFVVSNGGIGKDRLAHMGVDAIQSTQSVGRPTALGLLAAWLLSLVGVAAVFGIRWASRRVRGRGASDTDDPRADTAATATQDVPATGLQQESTTPASKEEQDDEHEPTNTTGAGIRLP
ncbi:DUF6350 family protein [Bifidobacterium biavatii]|uniref:Uncharacterized protein n=1 Tax=Bifidobacterium biavatii DSM 23969 TaxID=1437608 RepID=A0A086ZTD0_9BIFI|nr:DUF6350 family protein [Bifidobacterium biavatii]KFI49780.1 hypothetical protein BBIA_1469 [Bifidobacterium biavatii DSM 23969]